MPKVNYQYEKRQKELQKKRKKEEKLKQKLEKRNSQQKETLAPDLQTEAAPEAPATPAEGTEESS